MRLFFGLPLPPQTRAAAVECIARLASQGADIKWVEEENLHLTLRFLGAKEPGLLPELKEALARATKATAPFELVFDRLGCFGLQRQPKVIWAGLSQPCAALEMLAGALEKELAARGIAPETRPFHAHLTLGRVRSPFHFKEQAIAWPCRFEEVVLWGSRLSSRGPTYEPVASQRF